MRVLITTVPFGEVNRHPLDLLEQAGVDYVINPIGRKLREEELAEMISPYDIVIAGTEPITAKVIAQAPKLKLISRVGIGLDSVDLQTAQKRGIAVSYTPDAPSPAVAELTIGLMVSLLRSTHISDRTMREGDWRRFMGRRISNCTVGLVGMGRIGKQVTHLLKNFGCRILANDLEPDLEFGKGYDVEWVTKEELYKTADIISLHVPLTQLTKRLICNRDMVMMKPDAILLNTARGGIICEDDLAETLKNGKLGGAAIDAFEEEPYRGPLIKEERCLLTSHMGSMSKDCRYQMELESTQEALRFIQKEPLIGSVPDFGYQIKNRVHL
jgi:D-3-phosphoglycerate dehydrogenase / 2-oxoglutarate reductase